MNSFSSNRKKFISNTLLGTVGLMVAKFPVIHAQTNKPEPLQDDLVKEFVTRAHFDLDKVKEMLPQQPGLLNACWDWGGGDFETALEGAGHMGRKDIAQFLLENGARMNVFCAAMLGELELVKALLITHPWLKDSKGPHGLQLIHHATKGGDPAKPVLEYLQSIGAK